MNQVGRPLREEVNEYYLQYLDQVPDGDIRDILEAQLPDTIAFLGGVPADRIDHRYAPGKWTIREVLSHVNDTERLYSFRAFWFARGFDEPMPSFDIELARSHAAAGSRPWSSHVEEFRAVRTATVQLFRNLPPDAWRRGGLGGGNPFTVRALAYLAAGHVAHHMAIVRDRYLSSPA